MKYQWDFPAVWNHFDMLVVGLVALGAAVSDEVSLEVGGKADRAEALLFDLA